MSFSLDMITVSVTIGARDSMTMQNMGKYWGIDVLQAKMYMPGENTYKCKFFRNP